MPKKALWTIEFASEVIATLLIMAEVNQYGELP